MIDSATGGTRPEVGAAAACAGAKPECLVAWHQIGGANGEADERHPRACASISPVRSSAPKTS